MRSARRANYTLKRPQVANAERLTSRLFFIYLNTWLYPIETRIAATAFLPRGGKGVLMDRHVRWDAVWGGVMVSLVLSVGLGAISLAAHLIALTPEGSGIPFGSPNSAWITGAISIFALCLGGWAAGRWCRAQAPVEGAVHGFLAAGTTLVISLLAGAMGVSGLTAILMGPLNLHNFTQRALQGLSAPAEVAAGAAQVSGWLSAVLVLGLAAASWAGRLACHTAVARLAPRS